MDKLIYLYGIIPANADNAIPPMKGIDEHNPIFTIPFGEIEAVVCNLDEAEYREKELEAKTNNMEWVHEKAFHHHEALMTLYEIFTIIPMKFCTIYSGKDSLQNTIVEHKPKMIELLDVIAGKEEWIMKIYCDNSKLKENVAEDNPTIASKREEIELLSPGRQYLEKRKLDQLIEQETDKEKDSFSSRLHDQFAQFSTDSEVKKNWNKDVTGREEDMCWNSVYMLEQSTVEDFLANVQKAQDKWKSSGWFIEVTGPWPSYHFSKIS
ncbi:GvpL/GvpF family gas vesicle protein [Virgibacillus sp. C22-A2]|uniref:GvpL/GvpF family gas vesicle protein n=1 Tax=Virgibacillus tibetensis TaxID=3042313 RepID=A0ABU6KJE9_9BACI|nr:GvpL/GvpF family gas vesicle protein [Virgibacillus sp. C22-A2]